MSASGNIARSRIPMRCALTAAWLVAGAIPAFGQPWKQAMSAMALPKEAVINRDNCISVCLTNFESNAIVKALVFLPGVSDDFYLINRDRPKLDIRALNIFEALRQVTNATGLRLTFNSPFLLVHATSDSTAPAIVGKHAATIDALRRTSSASQFLCVDKHWDALQPILTSGLNLAVQPLAKSEKAWHFARHNFAAWGLTDFELLSCVSLSAGTKVAIERRRVTFTK